MHPRLFLVSGPHETCDAEEETWALSEEIKRNDWMPGHRVTHCFATATLLSCTPLALLPAAQIWTTPVVLNDSSREQTSACSISLPAFVIIDACMGILLSASLRRRRILSIPSKSNSFLSKSPARKEEKSPDPSARLFFLPLNHRSDLYMRMLPESLSSLSFLSFLSLSLPSPSVSASLSQPSLPVSSW
jgi:hypothetical protein